MYLLRGTWEIQGRLRKRLGKRTGRHRGTGHGAPGGSGGLGRGGPEEAEEITVTWVG